MSAYNCLIWSNSGFNAVNIPDGPALLMAMSYITVPVLELNQERFLPEVRVRATWSQVQNADYCKVGDFFYSVDDVFMSSGDVAVLSLTPDFITSAGGPAALEILDGVTSRCTVGDDSYAEYTEPDEYLAPAKPLKLVKDESIDFNADGYTSVVESSLDLYRMGDMLDETNAEYGDTANDPGSIIAVGGVSAEVAVPYVRQNEGGTYHYLPTSPAQTKLFPVGDYSGTGSGDSVMRVFKARDTNVRKGIQMARSLGLEGSISGQYALPDGLVAVGSVGADGGISSINGRMLTKTVNVPFSYSSAHNKRIDYSEYTPYGIITGNGSKLSLAAHRIYKAGATSPSVYIIADPRRGGCAYYRFVTLDGSDASNSNYRDFFRDAISGTPWREIPLTYDRASGSLIEQMQFNMSRKIADNSYYYERENVEWEKDLRTKMMGYKMAGSMLGGAFVGGPLGFAGGVAGAVATGVNTIIENERSDRSLNKLRMDYNAAKAQEFLQHGLAQGVYVPSDEYPANGGLVSDIIGHGCLVYRYEYNNSDVSRIDKILTMYGYKHTKALEAADFNRRTYFDYVAASISTGNLPKWWSDGISAQFGTGVRIWHVVPDRAHYNSNPIAS